MKRYEILEHTADLKIRGFGKTKEELLANLAFGLFSEINHDLNEEDKDVEKRVIVKAVDEQAMFVDFFNELLTLSDINDEIYAKYDLRVEGSNVTGRMWGKKVLQNDLDVKACTYNDLNIEKTKDGWMAEVVFDI
ncbi:archease [Patescibacteria group bacterium]|nr:archease [Patescibacteria group bacterium]MBU1673125.1 archease [Patescibacteria group bacterium]MBU1963803.1 archease [Patescibacteria group bacterium]